MFTHAEQELNVALGGCAWRGGPAAGSAAVDRWRAAQRRDGVRICGGRLCGGRLCGGRLCGWFGAGRAAAGRCSAGARCGWQSAGGWRAARSGGDSSAGDGGEAGWQVGPWAGSGPKSSRGLAVGAVGRALGHERFERWRRLFVSRQAVGGRLGGWSAGAGRAAGGGAGRTASPVGVGNGIVSFAPTRDFCLPLRVYVF